MLNGKLSREMALIECLRAIDEAPMRERLVEAYVDEYADENKGWYWHTRAIAERGSGGQSFLDTLSNRHSLKENLLKAALAAASTAEEVGATR